MLSKPIRSRFGQARMRRARWTAGAICVAALLCILLQHSRNNATTTLTLVTTLKSYRAPQSTDCSESHLQQMAILGWLDVSDEVIVLVDEEDCCNELSKISSRVKCHPHNCKHAFWGKPTMPCLLHTGEALASHPVVMFTNPDIVFSGLRETLAAAAAAHGSFLVVGGRTDMDNTLCEEMSVRTHTDLVHLAHMGTPHTKWAMDYYMFTKSSLPIASMPPFLIGNWRWDNWLLDATLRYRNVPVIDATATILALHISTTSVALRDRDGAEHNNRMWLADAGGRRPDPAPAGLGEMQFAQYFTVATAGSVEIVGNATAREIVRTYASH